MTKHVRGRIQTLSRTTPGRAQSIRRRVKLVTEISADLRGADERKEGFRKDTLNRLAVTWRTRNTTVFRTVGPNGWSLGSSQTRFTIKMVYYILFIVRLRIRKSEVTGRGGVKLSSGPWWLKMYP